VRRGWSDLLARAKTLDPLRRHLLVQMLQCHSRPTRGDFTLPRQGGLQRWVWPGDQKQVAAALTVLGYGEYVREACDFYFGEYLCADGEVGPFGNRWAGDTASVLEIFSSYCAETRDAAFWHKYRAAAAKACGWVRS